MGIRLLLPHISLPGPVGDLPAVTCAVTLGECTNLRLAGGLILLSLRQAANRLTVLQSEIAGKEGQMVFLGMLLQGHGLHCLQDTVDVSSILRPRQGLLHLLGSSSSSIPTVDWGVQVSSAPTTSTWTQLGEEWDPEEGSGHSSVFTSFETHMTA